MNKENGITLIALVITIIVLLILAGISISLVAGDNGILNKSDKAKTKTEQAAILEELRIKIYDKKTEDIENKSTNISYIKTAGYVADEFEEDNETCYVINPNRLNPVPSTGKGTVAKGDIYYLKTGDLYYLDSQKNATNLGGIYRETISNEEIPEDIFEYEDPEETILIGVKEEYIVVLNHGNYQAPSKNISYDIVKNGKSVTKIKIPDKVVRIDGRAFAHFRNIEEVIFGNNIKSFGTFTFLECESIKEINVPYGTVEIGYGAFVGCTNLSKIVIPETVENLCRCLVGGYSKVGATTGSVYIEVHGKESWLDFNDIEPVGVEYGEDLGYMGLSRDCDTVVFSK